jgi:DNA-binding phage protein
MMNSKKYLNDAELSARDDVARQIRNIKEEKGITITQLADDSGITSGHLCELYREDGDKIPSFRSMIRIFDALGLKEITIRWK